MILYEPVQFNFVAKPAHSLDKKCKLPKAQCPDYLIRDRHPEVQKFHYALRSMKSIILRKTEYDIIDNIVGYSPLTMPIPITVKKESKINFSVIFIFYFAVCVVILSHPSGATQGKPESCLPHCCCSFPSQSHPDLLMPLAERWNWGKW